MRNRFFSKYFSGGGVSLGSPRPSRAFPQTGGLRPKAKKRVPTSGNHNNQTTIKMKTNVIIKSAQKCAEKVLMANVVAGTGIISMVESLQEMSYNKATQLRSSRMSITEEQAAIELKAQHDMVVEKAKASAERVRSILSKKSISVQSN